MYTNLIIRQSYCSSQRPLKILWPHTAQLLSISQARWSLFTLIWAQVGSNATAHLQRKNRQHPPGTVFMRAPSIIIPYSLKGFVHASSQRIFLWRYFVLITKAWSYSLWRQKMNNNSKCTDGVVLWPHNLLISPGLQRHFWSLLLPESDVTPDQNSSQIWTVHIVRPLCSSLPAFVYTLIMGKSSSFWHAI